MARKPLLERVRDARRPRDLAWPTGRGDVGVEGPWGHSQEEFAPEEYGNYIATSNEVFSAVTLRARLMSSLTLKLYDRDGPQRREITGGRAYDLLRHVNPFWTRRRLAHVDEQCMGLWGESFWAIHRVGGVPVECWWMKPSRVSPVVHEDDYLGGFAYESATGQRLLFRADEVVWFRYPNPLDEFSPLSPMAAARLAADTAASMMKANQKLHKQGLQIGGLIVPTDSKATFSPEQAKELTELLDRRWSKEENAKRWDVLRYEAKFLPMSVNPKDAEYINGMNLTLRQVANAYGIPVTLLNDFENATLSNAREHKLLLWEHALVPDSKLRAEEIVEQFLPKFPAGEDRPGHAAYDYSEIPALQQAESESWTRERQAIEVGAITINEWRKDKGKPPVPWGDVYWRPVNKSAVDEPVMEPAVPDEPPAKPGDDLDAELARLGELTHWQARDFLAGAGLNGGNH